MSIVGESEQKTKLAEDSVTKATEAEVPLLKGGEDMSFEQATGFLSTLESVLESSFMEVSSAKTFVAMKRLAAKRLSEGATNVAFEELSKFTDRLEMVTKTLGETKGRLAVFRKETSKREIMARVMQAESKVSISSDALKALAELEGNLNAEEMKGACERAQSSQIEAQTALKAARLLVRTQQKDVHTISDDFAAVQEMSKASESISKWERDLDAQKELLEDHSKSLLQVCCLRMLPNCLYSWRSPS